MNLIFWCYIFLLNSHNGVQSCTELVLSGNVLTNAWWHLPWFVLRFLFSGWSRVFSAWWMRRCYSFFRPCQDLQKVSLFSCCAWLVTVVLFDECNFATQWPGALLILIFCCCFCPFEERKFFSTTPQILSCGRMISHVSQNNSIVFYIWTAFCCKFFHTPNIGCIHFIPFFYWQKLKLSMNVLVFIPSKNIQPFYYRKTHKICCFRFMKFKISAQQSKIKIN